MKQVVFIGVAILFLSCDKDEPTGPDAPCPDGTELREYMYFQPGTYWVYREQNSGIEDSMYVTLAVEDLDPIWWYRFYVVSALDSFEYSYWFDESWSIECESNLIQMEKTKPLNYQGQTIALFDPFIIGSKRYNWPATITITDVKKTYVLNAQTFEDVVIITNDINETENDNTTVIYYAKNVGIIKKELNNENEIWDLVRFYIIQ